MCGTSVVLRVVFWGDPALASEHECSVTLADTSRRQATCRVCNATGRGDSWRGEGELDSLDRVSLDVCGGVLTIRAKPDRFGQEKRNPGRVTLYLTTAAVRRVVMGGNGALQIDGMKGVSGELSLAAIGRASCREGVWQ